MRQTFDLLRDELGSLAAAPVRVAVRKVVELLFRAYAVEPALHRVFVEQVPRIGRLDRIREIEAGLAAVASGYLRAHRGELEVADCDLAAFVVIRSVAALAYATVIERDAPAPNAVIDEIVALVSRYLGLASHAP